MPLSSILFVLLPPTPESMWEDDRGSMEELAGLSVTFQRTSL